jgi:septal ring factor EnvC (AmiA/AmiB activator)
MEGTQEKATSPQDEVGIMDEFGIDAVKAAIENLKVEIEVFEQNIVQLKKDKENFEVQWECDKRVYDMVINNLKKITPEFEYETLPGYWECKKIQYQFKYRQDKHLSESKLKQYESGIEANTSELKAAKDKLKDLTKKLKKVH